MADVLQDLAEERRDVKAVDPARRCSAHSIFLGGRSTTCSFS